MSMLNALEKRRSIYALGRNMKLSDAEIQKIVEQAVALTPDAFNARSQRAVLLLGDEQAAFWDLVYDTFGGQVPREKTDMFKAAYGTVLFLTDRAVTEALQSQFPLYAERFPVYGEQAVGMLEINLWSLFAEQGIGASLQHYNPVIDQAVRERYQLPETWVLNAQMPFGSIEGPANEKEPEAEGARLKVFR